MMWPKYSRRRSAPESRLERAAHAPAGPWAVLSAALGTQMAVSVVEQGFPTLTPFIKQDLNVSTGVAGLVVSSLALGRIAGSYQAGRAVDRVGERSVLLIGGLVMGLLVLLAAVIPLAGALVVLVGVGACAATSTPAGGKLVLVSFPRRRRGLVMGIRQMGIPLGGLVAAVLLPALAQIWSWRMSLAAAGAIILVGVLAAYHVTGIDSRLERAEARARAVSERWSQLVRDRDVVFATAWACMIVSGQFAVVAFLALHAHELGGFPLTHATLLVALAQLGGMIGRVGWGLLSDVLVDGRRRPLLFVLTFVAFLVSIALATLPGHAFFAAYGLLAFLAGLSLIGWQGVWMTAIAELAGPHRIGVVSGFGLTFVALATAVSVPVYGFVADLAGSSRAIWITLAAVVALAFIPVALMSEPALRDESDLL